MFHCNVFFGEYWWKSQRGGGRAFFPALISVYSSVQSPDCCDDNTNTLKLIGRIKAYVLKWRNLKLVMLPTIVAYTISYNSDLNALCEDRYLCSVLCVCLGCVNTFAQCKSVCWLWIVKIRSCKEVKSISMSRTVWWSHMLCYCLMPCHRTYTFVQI